MAGLVVQFLMMLALGSSVFRFAFDIWPVNAEAWLIVLMLGVLVWFVLWLIERIFLRITDILVPAWWGNSRYIKQFLDDGPLLKSLNGSLFLFRLVRIFLLMLLVIICVNWLRDTIDLPSGYKIRSFMKEHWRVELRPV